MNVTDNSPSAGYISWSSVNIAYKGQTYTIADGNTNLMYVYWKYSDPTSFYGSNTYPTLGPDDLLVFVNKSGVHLTVPNTTVLDGSLLVPESVVAAALAANSVTTDKLAANAVTAAKIAANTITAAQIASNTITASQIAAGTITSAQIAANAIGASQIAADVITSDKLVLADFTNLCENPDFETDASGANPKGYISTTHARVKDISSMSGTNGSARALEIDALNGSNADIYATNIFPVTPGQVFYVEADGWYLNTAGTGFGRVGFRRYDIKKNGLSNWDQVATWPSSGKSTTVSRNHGTYTVPSGCYYLQIWISFANNAETTNKFYVDNVRVNRSASAELVVDGSITATKLAAGSVDASKISVSSLSAINANLGSITAGDIQGVTMNLAGGKFVVDSSGNVTMAGTLNGASGTFTGTIETSELEITAPSGQADTGILFNSFDTSGGSHQIKLYSEYTNAGMNLNIDANGSDLNNLWIGTTKLNVNGQLEVDGQTFLGGDVSANSNFTAINGVTVPNPGDSQASQVYLNWLNNQARLRVAGNGSGASAGFSIQGPGDAKLFNVDGTGIVSPAKKVTPMNDPGWQNAALVNSWTNYNNIEYGAAYYKDAMGFVHLRGCVKGGAVGSTIFTLPSGYLPSMRMLFANVGGGNALVRIDVDASGNVSFQAGSNSFVSLEGITFATF